jgi:hypothetical protein
MCLVAYVSLWTGLGLSLTTAAYLRWALLLLGSASLFFLILERLVRKGVLFRHFQKEVRPCNTR